MADISLVLREGEEEGIIWCSKTGCHFHWQAPSGHVRAFGTRKWPIAIALKIRNIHQKLQLLYTQKISVLCQSPPNENNNFNNGNNNNNAISLCMKVESKLKAVIKNATKKFHGLHNQRTLTQLQKFLYSGARRTATQHGKSRVNPHNKKFR